MVDFHFYFNNLGLLKRIDFCVKSYPKIILIWDDKYIRVKIYFWYHKKKLFFWIPIWDWNYVSCSISKSFFFTKRHHFHTTTYTLAPNPLPFSLSSLGMATERAWAGSASLVPILAPNPCREKILTLTPNPCLPARTQ